MRCALLACALLLGGCVRTPDFDLVVRGGDVVDGTGGPARRADVGVRGDRIAAVGDLEGHTAARTIDARGLVVAPGFIDMQGQSGLTLLADGNGESHIRQGITTEIIGEGGSPALYTPHLLDIDKSLKDTLLGLALRFDWRGFGGYLRRLEASGTSINVGSFASFDLVREEVIGFDDRAPTAAELQRMEALVGAAMNEGAFGLATALIYPPASFAKTPELIELARVAAQYGGIYISHVRGESRQVIEAIDEAIAIGDAAAVPVVIYHLKVFGHASWGRMREVGAHIDAARARGARVSACQYPYTAAGTGLAADLPGWAHEGGAEKLVARLADPSQRARMRAEMEGGGGGLDEVRLEDIQIAWVQPGSDQSVMGRRLLDIAATRKRDPWETLFDLLVENRGDAFAFYHAMSEDDVQAGLRLPWVSIGTDAEATSSVGELGRGLVHPRAYGTFPRILGRYVRDLGVLALPEAIRKMTSLAASQLGLRDRGIVRAGGFADLVVFDAKTVRDTATFERPREFPIGITDVVVNGKLTIDQGRHTGARAGRALRSRGHATGNEK